MPKSELNETINQRLKNLGVFICELRKYYNLNISEASKDMGINRNTLGNIERAVGDINLSTLFLIADFYGISTSELIKDMEEDS